MRPPNITPSDIELYQDLKDKAMGLLEASRALHDHSPNHGYAMITALCGAIAGLLLAPGSWPSNLPPMCSAVQAAVRDGLPDMERRLAEEKSEVN